MATNDLSVSIHPYFEVHEGKMAEFRRLCERFVETTRPEEGCLFYGFSFDGDEVFCREAYTDAAGLLKHLESVGPLLERASGMADLTRLEVHGPEAELGRLRAPLAEMKPRFFVLEYGFRV